MSTTVMAKQEEGSAPALRTVCAWAALLLAGHLPLLIRFAREQWGREQYQFFPLMLTAAAWLAWQRLGELPPRSLRPGRTSITGVLLAVSMLLFVAAGVFWSGRVAAISAWVNVIAIAHHLGGRTALRALTPSLVLLALVIGPPVGSDEPFLQALRELAVAISSGVLMLLNVQHLTTGTVIEIPGSRLLVAEACSGINSMMAVIGCTLVIGFSRRRSPRVITMLLLAGVLFVLWANIVRIAGGVWLKIACDVDILSGDAHEMASVVLFVVCILLVLCTDEAASLLGWLVSGERDLGGPTPVTVPPAQAVLTVPAPMWAVAVMFAILGGGLIAYAQVHGGLSRWMSEPAAVHLPPDAIFVAPGRIGDWVRSADAEKQIAQPELIGKRSEVWAYQNGPKIALVAIDYPFVGYHDLTVCYRNGGWQITAERMLDEGEGDQAGLYTVADLIRLNERGLVWFSALNEHGQWARPASESALGRVGDRLRHIGQPDWSGATYQVQLFHQAYEPIPDEQRVSMEELFLAVRRDLARQITEQLEGAR